VRTIAVLYPNRMHVVTIEGTGITKMADMKGKRLSTGSGGSATEVFAFRVIEAAGLDKDKDMRRERLGVAESVNALKDRKIDAFFWVGGLPTAAVTDLANSPGVKIRMIDIAHLVPEMAKKHGNIYVKDVIPQRIYNGMTADNQAATVTNLLTVNANMDDKTAYIIIKTLWEHRVDLVRVHAEAVNIKPENQRAANSSIPWHPAALKYFAEQGINVMGAGAAADKGAKKADKAAKK